VFSEKLKVNNENIYLQNLINKANTVTTPAFRHKGVWSRVLVTKKYLEMDNELIMSQRLIGYLL
jgi:hypothetical protein